MVLGLGVRLVALKVINYVSSCVCSAQSKNLRNLEIALHILRILRLRSNREIAHHSCAILRLRMHTIVDTEVG